MTNELYPGSMVCGGVCGGVSEETVRGLILQVQESEVVCYVGPPFPARALHVHGLGVTLTQMNPKPSGQVSPKDRKRNDYRYFLPYRTRWLVLLIQVCQQRIKVIQE